MEGIDTARIWAVGGGTVCVELRLSHMDRELLSVGIEIYVYPPDVMFGLIRMGDLFSNGKGIFGKLTLFNGIRSLDYRAMFFRFPVSLLIQF